MNGFEKLHFGLNSNKLLNCFVLLSEAHLYLTYYDLDFVINFLFHDRVMSFLKVLVIMKVYLIHLLSAYELRRSSFTESQETQLKASVLISLSIFRSLGHRLRLLILNHLFIQVDPDLVNHFRSNQGRWGILTNRQRSSGFFRFIPRL
jgi:hypothetical protein